jgi:hypothetical protein
MRAIFIYLLILRDLVSGKSPDTSDQSILIFKIGVAFYDAAIDDKTYRLEVVTPE